MRSPALRTLHSNGAGESGGHTEHAQAHAHTHTRKPPRDEVEIVRRSIPEKEQRGPGIREAVTNEAEREASPRWRHRVRPRKMRAAMHAKGRGEGGGKST